MIKSLPSERDRLGVDKENIVQFSGGKDSTAMLLRLLEEGHQVDEIVFCDTGKEFPQMYEHIAKVKDYIKQYNKTITTITAKHSFDYYFCEYKRTRGKYANEKGYGWPGPRRRWCTWLLKTKPLQEYLKGRSYNLYLGIAIDEPKRIKDDNYPLVEWKMTENDCLQYCYNKGFDWSGLYREFKRVSCYMCPLQRVHEWRILRSNHRDLWEDALRLDEKTTGFKFQGDYTLRDLDKRFEREDMQTVLPMLE